MVLSSSDHLLLLVLDSIKTSKGLFIFFAGEWPFIKLKFHALYFQHDESANYIISKIEA